MSVKKEDLNPEQRKTFDMWRRIGLSESAALNAMIEDGVVKLNDHDRLVGNFRKTFGLSEEAAEIAARGRGGGRSRAPITPVSEAGSLAGLRPDPANIRHVVTRIEEIASDSVRRGVAEEKALRDAAFEVMRVMPDERTADWVVRVVESRWPGSWARGGSSSGTVYG